MALYRVTFMTSVLVDTDCESEAERLGYYHLVDEVKNGCATSLHSIETINKVSILRGPERGSLPWRDSSRRNEPELKVEEIIDLQKVEL